VSFFNHTVLNSQNQSILLNKCHGDPIVKQYTFYEEENENSEGGK
jgi:hypothetical protein